MICEARTDVGSIRTINQDSLLVDNDNGLYLLADGMGGHQAGEVASKLAIHVAYAHLLERIKVSDAVGIDIQEIMGEAFLAAHIAVKESACGNPQYKGMGTTLLAVLIDGNKAYVCSVGDSRLYLIRRAITQITVDDTLGSFLLTNNKMSAEKMPDKYWNMLTQAIGGESQISASTKMIRFFPDDMLIMCSDGLYGMISDKEIQEISYRENIGLDMIADELLTKALNNGGKDNVTLILIKQ